MLNMEFNYYLFIILLFYFFFFLGASSSGTSALSALVRDRVRKKALDNINKKSAFEHVDPSSAFGSSRPEEFSRWYVVFKP